LQQEHRLLSHLSEKWIREELKTDQQSAYFSIQSVLEHTEPEWALHQLVKSYLLSSTQEKNLFELLTKKQANGKCILTESHRFEIRDDKVLISLANQERKALSMLDFSFELIDRAELTSLHVPQNVALLDADLVSEHELKVRYYQSGDWFIPFGMSGKKLLSDFFKDLKWSKARKENQLVLCKGETIVWVVNERIDQRFAISDSTQKVLSITYKTM
jgi:tRNA(Ile)-lysidine synthase